MASWLNLSGRDHRNTGPAVWAQKNKNWAIVGRFSFVRIEGADSTSSVNLRESIDGNINPICAQLVAPSEPMSSSQNQESPKIKGWIVAIDSQPHDTSNSRAAAVPPLVFNNDAEI